MLILVTFVVLVLEVKVQIKGEGWCVVKFFLPLFFFFLG